YDGPDAAAVRLMAVRGSLDEAQSRIEGCGAEPGLVELCRRCLSADPGRRPADAGEVAGAVAAIRTEAEDRAHRAEPERARAAALQAGERADQVGASAEVRQRVRGLVAEIEQVEKNRRLVATLLDIQDSMGDVLTSIGNQDFSGADARYERAFRDYGTDVL